MKILHTECGMNWGGGEFRTLLECEWLNRHGHEAWIMCHPQSQLFKKAEERKFSRRLPLPMLRPWRVDRCLRILNECRRLGIAIINSHGSRDTTMCLLAKWAGVPLVRSRHVTAAIKKSFSYRLGCTHILATAYAIKKLLVDAGVPAKKITVIGEGVDLEEFNPDTNDMAVKAEFGLDQSDLVVVNIGMLRRDKGQIYLVQAMVDVVKEIPSAKMLVIGGGWGDADYEDSLRNFIDEHQLNENVILTGYRSDIAALTAAADIIVIASISVEAQSRVAPQSFAAGKPVVSTNVGGLTEVVTHEITGLVVPPADSKALADAILRLHHSPESRERLSSNALRLARDELSFDRMMERTLSLYQSLLD